MFVSDHAAGSQFENTSTRIHENLVEWAAIRTLFEHHLGKKETEKPLGSDLKLKQNNVALQSYFIHSWKHNERHFG